MYKRQLPFPLLTLGRNAPHIIEQFRHTPGAVLLATGAAWEGFDLSLIHIYLPLLSCVLMADGILTKPLKAVIRKGKSHYVCDERLDRRLRQILRQHRVLQRDTGSGNDDGAGDLPCRESRRCRGSR